MEKAAVTIKEWIKRNPDIFLIGLILILGALLRLYRISEYMTFLGDEGRDAIVVRRLLVNFDPILVGPGTSIGNMYLGPAYYYLIAPALLLANFSPVGPAVLIAVLGIATIFLVWYLAREWFPSSNKINTAGFIAALLYAVSPVVIIYSRSSWNPNVMPFLALFSILGIWRVWKYSDYKWLLIVGVSFALVLQSHYLGLLLLPTLVVVWVFGLVRTFNTKETGKFVKYSIASLMLFLFVMSPLAIFDARHDWRNFNAMKEFFFNRQTTVSIRPWNSIPKMLPLSEKIVTRLIAGTDQKVGRFAAILFGVMLAWLLFAKREVFNDRKLSGYLVIALWLGFAIVGLGLYKQEIYDHYYGFFFPAPFILLGALMQDITTNYKSNVIKTLALLVLIILLYSNIANSPIRFSPNRQLQRSIDVSKSIENESRGEKFNFAVIAERNYEGAYQYFFEKDNANFVIIDAQRPETTANQLFVICELPESKCDPTHNSKAEVANFGWSVIEKKWEVSGTLIFKLIHSSEK